MHALYKFLDGLNDGLGRLIAWLTLGMVLVQFALVLSRYLFSISSLWWQESVVYMHGAVIMLAAGYTLLHNGHVRVDIFYREASETTKDVTDLVGSLLFLIPVCYVIAWSAWPNVALAWAQLEGSTESSGIPYKYVLKTTVLAFAILVGLQALSTLVKAAMRLAGHQVDDPYREEESLD
ncbi:MAG: TRAP transporter small permease subunit [Pseudomonadota bacterium]